MKLALSVGLLLPALVLAGAPGPGNDENVVSPAVDIEHKLAPQTQATTVSPDLSGPPEFAIKFRLRYSAFSANIRLALRKLPDSDDYQISATTKARGLVKLFLRGKIQELGTFSFSGGRVIPHSYILESGKKSGEDSGELAFDWQRMVIDSVYEGTPATLPLEPGIYDRISADAVVIMQLRNGISPPTLHIAEKNQVRDYVLTYQGEERIKTPAGEFDTVIYLRQREGSSRSTRIWYAKNAGFLPVRIEQLKHGKSVVTSVAQSVTLKGATD